jgi:hypothetical protein
MKLRLRNLSHGGIRIAAGFVLLTMPIGYYKGDPDSADVAIAMHGGFGQAAYTSYSCSGELTELGSARFRDVSGTAYTAIPPRRNSPWALSVTAGTWEAYTGFPRAVFPDTTTYVPTYTYVIPILSYESRRIGFGLGPVFGDLPSDFGDYKKPRAEPLTDRIRIAGHLRFGNPDRLCVSMRLMENAPLASGGGFFDIGIGAPLDRKDRIRTYWALSAGLYDKAGFLQQTRFRLAPNWDVDFAGRIGGAEGITEYGISGGLVYYPWRRP